MSFIYLATPYSHPLPYIRESRYRQAVEASRVLTEAKIPHYSPIIASHAVSLSGNFPFEYSFWQFSDEAFIRACSELWVIRIEGWMTSKGIESETAFAELIKKPVGYIHLLNLAEHCATWRASSCQT